MREFVLLELNDKTTHFISYILLRYEFQSLYKYPQLLAGHRLDLAGINKQLRDPGRSELDNDREPFLRVINLNSKYLIEQYSDFLQVSQAFNKKK
jgi:hypothetical protein